MTGRVTEVAGRSACLQLMQKALEFMSIQSFSHCVRANGINATCCVVAPTLVLFEYQVVIID
eukprot:COSAG02_NODE_109_length_36250_cov_121.168903_26_plen_62_part_00